MPIYPSLAVCAIGEYSKTNIPARPQAQIVCLFYFPLQAANPLAALLSRFAKRRWQALYVRCWPDPRHSQQFEMDRSTDSNMI